MTITKFRQTHKPDAITLPFSQIVLVEPCHINASRKHSPVKELLTEPLCIVRELDTNIYGLVVGYRDYMTARNLGAETINAIVVPDPSRKAFLKSLDNTFEMWNLSDVHEPKGWTSPSAEKIYTCVKHYEETGTFGKKIFVTPDGTILDGYAAVCAAREIKAEKIPVYTILPQRWKKFSKNKKSKTP